MYIQDPYIKYYIGYSLLEYLERVSNEHLNN